MPERLILSPVEARITLLNEVFGTHTDQASCASFAFSDLD